MAAVAVFLSWLFLGVTHPHNMSSHPMRAVFVPHFDAPAPEFENLVMVVKK